MTLDQVLNLPSVSWSDRRLLPESPGLYFVITDDQVTYVGKTVRTLRKRWLYRSEELRRFQYFGEFRIAYTVIEDAEVLGRAERDFIRRFRPPLNMDCVPNALVNMADTWPHLRWDRPFLPPARP